MLKSNKKPLFFIKNNFLYKNLKFLIKFSEKYYYFHKNVIFLNKGLLFSQRIKVINTIMNMRTIRIVSGE